MAVHSRAIGTLDRNSQVHGSLVTDAAQFAAFSFAAAFMLA